MANNSQQERQPEYTGSDSGSENPVEYERQPNREPYPAQQYRQYQTQPAQYGGGFADIIPSILPAIQSGSYVLVIIAGFTLWSSRSRLGSFLDKHIALVEVVKESLDKQIDTNEAQTRVLQQLVDNNTRLISTIEVHGLSPPTLKVIEEPQK